MKLSKVSRGSSGEPPSASCTAEIGAAPIRTSAPFSLVGASRIGAVFWAGTVFAVTGRTMADRTVISTREMPGCSACQHDMTFSV